MAEWPDLHLESLLRALVSHGVDFVIVGGIAVVAHGSARITRDLDICYATDQANLDVLGAALLDLDARLRGVPEPVPFVPDGRALRRTTILTLDTDHGWIDLLAAPSGAPPYAALRQRAERVTFGDIAVLVASLDDLEAMKRAAGRPRDLIDVEEIAVIRRLKRRAGQA
ncbi:MAG TPA: nucleotidyl transferase AbiEii/AbiGii toxin family protein [Solirubrobacteraceae bacterium]|nr:nucleotidyl transferase AbiEii/AbiGii toxin family protein [Solirubrobacteraceae bacterium]